MLRVVDEAAEQCQRHVGVSTAEWHCHRGPAHSCLDLVTQYFELTCVRRFRPPKPCALGAMALGEETLNLRPIAEDCDGSPPISATRERDFATSVSSVPM